MSEAECCKNDVDDDVDDGDDDDDNNIDDDGVHLIPGIQNNSDYQLHKKRIDSLLPQPFSLIYVQLPCLLVEYEDFTPFRNFKKKFHYRIGGLIVDCRVTGPSPLHTPSLTLEELRYQEAHPEEPATTPDCLPYHIHGQFLSPAETLILSLLVPSFTIASISRTRTLWIGLETVAEANKYNNTSKRPVSVFGGLQVRYECCTLDKRIGFRRCSLIDCYPSLSPGHLLAAPWSHDSQASSSGVLVTAPNMKKYLIGSSHAMFAKPLNFLNPTNWLRMFTTMTDVCHCTSEQVVGSVVKHFSSPREKVGYDIALLQLKTGVNFQNSVQGVGLTRFAMFDELIIGSTYRFCCHWKPEVVGAVTMMFAGFVNTDSVRLALFVMDRTGNMSGACGCPIYDDQGVVYGFFRFQLNETEKALIMELPDAFKSFQIQ